MNTQVLNKSLIPQPLLLRRRGVDFLQDRKFTFKRKNLLSFLFVLVALTFFVSCKKEKKYVYDVNGVNVAAEASAKQTTKTTTEFISIAYSDLYGNTISNDELTKLSLAYSAFGDKKLIENLIIKNFLNNGSVIIPTKAAMLADLDKFILKTYSKFYNRTPNEFEAWMLKNAIIGDATITPELVYYSMMTSDEYRYY